MSKKVMIITEAVQMEAELNDSKTAAYWPEGRCFCIFFGKTPASTDTEIKPASPVNLVGRFSGDPELWKKVAAGNTIRLEAARD